MRRSGVRLFKRARQFYGRSGVRHLQRKFCKVRANRPPRCGHLPPETRYEYVPIGSSKTSLFLKVSGWRYPHPGVGRWIVSGFFVVGEARIPRLECANNVRRQAMVRVMTYQDLARQEVEKEPTGMYSWRVLVSHYPYQRPSPRQRKKPPIVVYELSKLSRCYQL